MNHTKQGLPILELPDAPAWEQWLHRNHRESRGVWLKIAKKGSPARTATYAEALAVAKAFFDRLTGVRRYAFLVRLHKVQRPQGRKARIASYIELLSERRSLI